MPDLPPPLTASRDVLTPILQLSLSLVVLLLSLLLLLIESRLSPRRPRLLADGEALSQTLPSPAHPQLPPTATAADALFDASDHQHPDLPHPDLPHPHPAPAEPQQAPQSPRLPKRAKACLAALRLLLALALAASLCLPGLQAINYISAPPAASLAPDRPNRWTQALLKRAVLKYATDAAEPNATVLATEMIRVGVGPRADAADAEANGRLRWSSLLTLVAIVSLAGAVLAVLAEKLPVKRAVAWLVFAQALLWLVISVAVALIRPTKLPLDAAPLVNHWMDRVYERVPEYVNETRFLENWFVALPDHAQPGKETVVPLVDYPGFAGAFCTQFAELLPRTGSEVVEDVGGTAAPATTTALTTTTTPGQTEAVATTATTTTVTTAAPTTTEGPPPEEEEPPSTNPPPTGGGDRPTLPPSARLAVLRQEGEESAPEIPSPDTIAVDPLPPELAGEVFLVYLVGKPIGLDQYRILSYMALGAIVGAPVAVAQMCRTWILYPFVGLWAAVWVLFFMLATPSVLRVLTVPVEKAQIFEVCGVNYRVLVADGTTMLIARLDVAFFGVVLLIALVQGYRWLRLAERTSDEEDEKEVKLVNYEDVYSVSGSLRW